MKNHYQTLGLNILATPAEIKTAYKKLAKKFHPDKNNGDPVLTEKFKEISEAYEILSDQEKRKRYDENWKYFSETKRHQNRQATQNTHEPNPATQNTRRKRYHTKTSSDKTTNITILYIAILFIGLVIALFVYKPELRTRPKIAMEPELRTTSGDVLTQAQLDSIMELKVKVLSDSVDSK